MTLNLRYKKPHNKEFYKKCAKWYLAKRKILDAMEEAMSKGESYTFVASPNNWVLKMIRDRGYEVHQASNMFNNKVCLWRVVKNEQ